VISNNLLNALSYYAHFTNNGQIMRLQPTGTPTHPILQTLARKEIILLQHGTTKIPRMVEIFTALWALGLNRTISVPLPTPCIPTVHTLGNQPKKKTLPF
jgi:hypothetical protein